MDGETHKLTFTGPAVYRIIVEGQIPDSFLESFGEMRLKRLSFSEDGIESILEGRIADQAQLSGILKTLYKLHLSIRSIALQHPN